MAIVTYNYDPGQAVWVITNPVSTHKICPSSVRGGVVNYVRINVTTTIPPAEKLYDILLDGDNGPTTFLEDDVFVSLSDATTAYEVRLAPVSP